MSYYIYKICCDDLPEFIYVGSTKAFRQRKAQHKMDYNKGDIRKIYNTIRENGGWDNWRMVILEECREISFMEARIKEEEYRVKLNANMNSIKCYVTEEQKKEQNKEYQKEYVENNKEYINQRQKNYYDENKDKNKNYREANKDKILEYQKKYRENNKDKINQKQNVKVNQKKNWNEKVTCDCGSIISLINIKRHKETPKHLELMKHLEKI